MASNFFELNEDFNYPFCNKVSIKSQKNKKIYPRVYGRERRGVVRGGRGLGLMTKNWSAEL